MDKHDGPEAGSAPASLEDPWYDTLSAGWEQWDDGTPDTPGHGGAYEPSYQPLYQPSYQPVHDTARTGGAQQPNATDEIYLAVQRSPEFREVRSQYRRFVVPGALAFLGWYLVYVVAATAAPGLMAHQVAGAVNVAMLAGIGQFATTFLLTWAYARHARLRRDQAALDLRWDVTMQTRDTNL
ncbi:DUF485 domain-containing protein [Streptomyces polyrhachis]|uniref:DUF485 domain-containing protein n=1 Tax=Streptomyces polyrhachis TaxID=1282885 RepID=A0ABW2GGT8_9ACTN